MIAEANLEHQSVYF